MHYFPEVWIAWLSDSHNMSGFWTGIRNKKSSHKSIRELAQEHASQYKPPIYHVVNNCRDYYGPFKGPNLRYTNPNNYSHMYHSEHFYSAPPTHSSSLDHLISRAEVLEARKSEGNVDPKSSRSTEVIVCILCRSTNNLTKNCLKCLLLGSLEWTMITFSIKCKKIPSTHRLVT